MPLTIHGIIKAGTLIKMDVDFICVECGAIVPIQFNQSITDSTLQMFSDMVHKTLCLKCYNSSKMANVIIN